MNNDEKVELSAKRMGRDNPEVDSDPAVARMHGHKYGWYSGYNTGIVEGLASGHDTGNRTGYGLGLEDGRKKAGDEFQRGYESGRVDGRAIGHRGGYEKGFEEGRAYATRTVATLNPTPLHDRSKDERLALLGSPPESAYQPGPRDLGYAPSFLEATRAAFRDALKTGDAVNATRFYDLLLKVADGELK